jgi:hypothetical protein
MDTKTGTSLTLIEGRDANREERIERKAQNMHTFSLDYEKKRTKDYSLEDLEIPAFLRRSADAK